MGRYQLGAADCLRGASGRVYTIRCSTAHSGMRQWFVGSAASRSWGTPFVSEPQARAWAREH